MQAVRSVALRRWLLRFNPFVCAEDRRERQG